MNDRKQHVIGMAHQLFIEKGFQATSIQDILEYSGISKGTFYNYFSSKNELLKAIFKTIFKKMDKERDELLIGKDKSDIEIFIKQMELQMKSNKKNNLFTLFEEVLFSNDEDLKEFIKRGHLMMLHWLYNRFIDIFGESKKPYLLDCAIMFMGILHQNLHFKLMANGSGAKIHKVVRYSVDRIVKIVDEVAESGDQLIEQEFLETWLPDCEKNNKGFQKKLFHTVLSLKKTLTNDEEQIKYIELLDFISEELQNSRTPRKFLINSALFSLKANQADLWKKELQLLEEIISSYFNQLEETSA
ncbi:TetR/AcrR family transcriptional regulator [Neobacillus ginsengisoli]|uniref:AcrR family transcriptional regulator n=1 Tax=Neobacillus ginsengisoli TaxID=904295 RepID=A0ABT9Y0N6_9BACI|nr:TetR/AcrR family transcriptional regulator [Neobacillus ginsengisoli]MDQ0201397.1 AcrR family transcriptional regulator [Neobacillus ginsengisoli]